MSHDPVTIFHNPACGTSRNTLAAIEQELLVDGYVQRYTQTPENTADGLPPGEGAFLARIYGVSGLSGPGKSAKNALWRPRMHKVTIARPPRRLTCPIARTPGVLAG